MKIKTIIFSLLLCLATGVMHATPHYNCDSLILVLDAVLDSSSVYDAQMRKSVERHLYAYNNAPNLSTKFNEAGTLYARYRKLRLDSSLYYARVCVKMAPQFGVADTMTIARLWEADALKCLGRYQDALAILKTLPHDAFLKANPTYYNQYHSILLSLYNTTTDADEKAQYKQMMLTYRDSVNQVNKMDALAVCTNTCELLKSRGKFREALATMEKFLAEHADMVMDNAIYWYTLADTYKSLNNNDGAKYCYTMAAIIDLRKGSKTYKALQDLAMLLYKDGDTERAYQYITRALNDVIAAGSRNRLEMVSTYLPIITTAYEQKQHTLAVRRNIFLGILSVFAIMLVYLLYVLMKRNKKLSSLRERLAESNTQLTKLNGELATVNSALLESNNIKEAYIAQLFNLCSEYIDNIDKYRLNLMGKFKAGREKEMEAILKKSVSNEHLKTLFRNFDMIFLELFPEFIERFNGLLREDERIEPKEGELLTPELRIYALVRLGINDSTKIASFLHYSSQTVYNYRLKVRNKALVPKEDFVAHVQSL